MRTVLVCACLALCACSSSNQAASSTSAAVTSSPAPSGPTVSFDASWHETVGGGSLVAGGAFVLSYDPARLPTCRAYNDGYPGWQITATVRFWPGGATASYPLFDHASSSSGPPDYHSWVEQFPTVPIPAGTSDVEMWFENVSGFDQPCDTWDSDYGRNFHFAVIVPAATLHFRSDWTVAVDGTVRGGQPIAIDYDLARLPACRAQYNGGDAWAVAAWYRFDGGPASSMLATTSGFKELPALVPLSVPPGTRKVELWFENSDEAGCLAWDSDYGANYAFPAQ